MTSNLRRFPIQSALIALALVAGVWVLGANMQAAPKDEPLRAVNENVESGLERVSFQLKHVSATEAQRMLRELLGSNADSANIVADSPNSQLRVAGDATTIQLAKRLLGELDRPPKDVKASAAIVRTYECVNRSADAIAYAIRTKFGSAVNLSASGNRLIVVANPATQRSVAAFREQLENSQTNIANSGTNHGRTLIPRIIHTPPRSSVDQTLLTVDIAFRNRTTTTLQSGMTQLLGDRLRSLSNQSSIFQTTDGLTVNIQFANDSVCRLHGPTFLVNQFATLMKEWDIQQDGQKTRFIRLLKADRAALNKALNGVRNGGMPSGGMPSGSSGQQYAPQQPQSNRFTTSSNIQQTAFQQNGGFNQPMGNPAEAQLRRPGSDVKIEALPDLDVIILQGRDADVDELTRIIKEIERISEETTPQIELYHLQNARGAAVDELIKTVLDDLIGPLQGRVSITPLQKPNALLLIGWGEAVGAVKELIAKLDTPVPSQTQVKVFPLKNSSATDIRETITQFFNDRGGLGTEAIINADIRTNSVIVNAAPRDLEEVALLIGKLDSGTNESVNQAKMLKLKNSLAADIAGTVEAAIEAARGGAGNGRSAVLEMLLSGPDGDRVLKSGLLGDVRVVPDPRTNTLFLSGPAQSIKLVEELINRLDETPAASSQLKVFQVRHGSAGELVQVLRTLFPTQGTAPQLATAAGESSLAPVRFSVDARTNAIIATGSSGDMKIVEALLIRLDQDGSQQRENKVYRLRNSPALDVAQAVNEFLRSERIVQLASPGSNNPFQQIETEVVVVPEPVGNSLLISATPRFFDEIMKLVEDLDEQPAQVQIQVILAEVELGTLNELGVEVGLQDSLLFDRGLLGDLVTTTETISTSTAAGVVTNTNQIIQAASNTPGFNFNNNPIGNSGSDQSLATAGAVAGQALSHFAVGRVNSELGYGGLVLSASSENVSVLIRALNQSRRVDVLSRPHIMTLDNQPAFIQVGQRVPRITGSTINQIGQVNNVELEDVGLILGVTPRISPDGMVVMEVDAEKSEIGPENEGIPVSISASGEVVRSPRVNIAMAQTTVSAASGQTVILGGLITNRTVSITRRVPWLSDIPLFGELFKYDGMDNKRTELLIILTPHVIRNRADAEHVKQLEMSRMSWCSQDVFEWLSPNDEFSTGATIDDSGVPVIYPDDQPGAPDLQSVPETTFDSTPGHSGSGSNESWDLQPMSHSESGRRKSGVVSADHLKITGSDSKSPDDDNPIRTPGRWPFRRTKP